MDIKRFCKYFVYTLRLNCRTYLIAIGALIGAMVLPSMWSVLVDPHSLKANYSDSACRFYLENWGPVYDPEWYTMLNIFHFGLFIFGCIAASMTFRTLANKGSRLTELMVPASKTEKFLANWIICVPVALVVFYLCFEVADLLRLMLYSLRLEDTSNLHPFFTSANRYVEDVSLWSIPVTMFFALQSWFVLGSAVWPKNSVIKSLVALLVYGTVVIMFTTWLANTVFKPDMVYGTDMIEDSVENAQRFFRIISYILAVAFTVLAYWRYRQIEIIQRW